jgi:hypothetical protein
VGVRTAGPFLWHRQDTFHDAFCQDLDDTESLVMATTQRPLARRCFDDVTGEPAWNTKQAGIRSRPKTE